jgi:hypothetical protein
MADAGPAGSDLAVKLAGPLCWTGMCLLWFPGILNNDSVHQFEQALSGNFNDFQPPIMAALWRLMLPLRLGHGSLFVVNTTFYWVGLTFVSRTLWRKGSRPIAVAALLSGLSPLLLYQDRFVITDVGLGSALIAVFGVAFWFRSQGRALSPAAWAFVVAASAYALLIRANASFAVVPCLLYAAKVDPRGKPMTWALLAAALIVVSIPASMFVNRQVIGARDSGGFERLPIYDLVGTSYFSGSSHELRRAAPRAPANLAACYTPLFWDTFMTSRCDGLWWTLPKPGSSERKIVRREWVEAAARHPLAYVKHRLLHFNAEVLFLVPPAVQCASAPEMHNCGPASSPERREVVWKDYVFKNGFAWPITWLTVGLGLLLFVRSGRDPASDLYRALLASGLFYGGSYFFVGVASNVRYFFWTYLAFQLCILLVVANRKEWASGRAWVGSSTLVGVVLLIGYSARLTDSHLFIW